MRQCCNFRFQSDFRCKRTLNYFLNLEYVPIGSDGLDKMSHCLPLQPVVGQDAGEEPKPVYRTDLEREAERRSRIQRLREADRRDQVPNRDTQKSMAEGETRRGNGSEMPFSTERVNSTAGLLSLRQLFTSRLLCRQRFETLDTSRFERPGLGASIGPGASRSNFENLTYSPRRDFQLRNSVSGFFCVSCGVRSEPFPSILLVQNG